MFLPVILDFENNGLKFMLLKYLRFLDLSIQNDWAIITHEEFDKYEINFPNRSEYGAAMMKKYGYKLHDYEERCRIHQYFIPSSCYIDKEKTLGSKLDRALYFLDQRDRELEDCFKKYFDEILHTYDEPIEAVLYFASCPKSLKCVCDEYNIPMIAYETGPIREPNYRCNTSYFCRNGLYGVDEIYKRWEKFKNVVCKKNLPVLTREEIIAMFIAKEHIGFLEQIDREPEFQIGVACGCALVVPYFDLCKYTDHELLDDIFELYNYNEIFIRLHPGDMYTATYRLNVVDGAATPFPFLINSKRIAAVGSNMLLEAMLWKRIACCKTEVMPATMMCCKDYLSDIENDDTELFVNFFIFSFLVPMELACDTDYIRWRLENPSEDEIYLYHFDYYLESFGINKIWLQMRIGKRLEYLKMHRSYSGYTDEYFEKSVLKKIVSTSNLKNMDADFFSNVAAYYFKYIEAQQEIEDLKKSTSWRIMEPFRRMFDKLKGLE